MSNNELMHNTLAAVSEAIADLELLAQNKAFRSDEWQNFIVRRQTQLQQIHRAAWLRIWKPS